MRYAIGSTDKMKLKKKGLALSTIATLIIVILIMVILLAFISLLYSKNLDKELVAENKCRMSAKILRTLSHSYDHEAFADSLECPTMDVVIEEKDPEEVMRGIADHMDTCLSIFFDPGQEGNPPELFNDKGVVCLICHRISFSEGLGGRIIDREEFESFLKDEYPNRGSLTYYDRFAGLATGQIKMRDLVNDDDLLDTIDTSKTYATVFVYAKGYSFIEGIKNSIKKLVRKTLGFIAGAAYSMSISSEPEIAVFIMLKEYDVNELSDLADLGCYMAGKQSTKP